MPRRWRWLVPLTALTACVLPRAGASAAPQLLPDPPIPPVADRVDRVAQATTTRAIASHNVRARARAARDGRADRVVDVAVAQIGDGYAWGGSGPDAFVAQG